MGAQGTAVLDFGAFPGKSDASVAVTGQAGILAGSLVEAWIRLEATADHSADEHLLETIGIKAGNIVPGTGFTIYGFNTSQINESILDSTFYSNVGIGGNKGRGKQGPGETNPFAGLGTRIYGQWTVAWGWN